MKRARLAWWISPPYGSRRYRLRRWLKLHELMTRARHERELAKVRQQADAHARARILETKKEIDQFLPRIASGVIEYERQQQAFRLTTFVGDAIVRSLADYPGDHDAAWHYVGERLGHEVTRQLRTLDFGTLMQGPRVLIGDRFIIPPPYRP